MTDYRTFRLSKINEAEFCHLKLLLFWPIFGMLFWFLERFYPARQYYVMYSRWDDLIPFCELFLIPYLFWFVYLVGMHLYTLLYDTNAFRKFMWFIIITYCVTIVIYFVFPTCQNLRPETFARDNLFTRFIENFYQFDTNTNVCPSLHVIGSVAVYYASQQTERFRTRGWKWVFGIITISICVSTVFMKQHSVLDVIAAMPVCYIAYKLIERKEYLYKESKNDYLPNT